MKKTMMPMALALLGGFPMSAHAAKCVMDRYRHVDGIVEWSYKSEGDSMAEVCAEALQTCRNSIDPQDAPEMDCKNAREPIVASRRVSFEARLLGESSDQSYGTFTVRSFDTDAKKAEARAVDAAQALCRKAIGADYAVPKTAAQCLPARF